METKKRPNNLKRATPEGLRLLKSTRKSQANLLQVPLAYATGLSKALTGLGSAKSAIKAKCHECVGYDETKERISKCSNKRCALLAYRPYQLHGAT